MILYKQNDSAWRNLRLGRSKWRIGSDGCVVCILASLCCHYGHAETPATLVRKLRFTSNGLIIWKSLTALYPDIKFITRVRGLNRYVPYSKIDYALDVGFPVVLEVRLGRYRHFVLAYAKTGSNYLIVDSAKRYKGSMRKHYQKIYGYAEYRGIVPKPAPKPKPKKTKLNIDTSIVDYLRYRGLRSNFGARAWYYRKAFGSRYYWGSRSQNVRLLQWAKKRL